MKQKLSLALVMVGGLLLICFMAGSKASAASSVIYPDGDITTEWSTFGTRNGNCTGQHCGRVDNNPINTSSGIETTTVLLPGNASRTDVFSMQNATVGQVAESIVVRTHVRATSGVPILDAMDSVLIDLYIGGQYVSGANAVITPTTTWTTYTTTFTGSWSQSDINNLQVRVRNQVNGLINLLQNNLQVAGLHAEVFYVDTPTLHQSHYRKYHGSSAVIPGAPLAPTNIMGELPTPASSFRLRTAVRVEDAPLLANNQQFKLQYSNKTPSGCSASFTDVSAGSGDIRWHDSPGISNGAAITSFADDPHTGGSNVHQTYRESAPFAATTQVPIGAHAVWDFSLREEGAEPGAIYCLRIAQQAGGTLASYNLGEVMAVGDLTVQVVDDNGNTIPSPYIDFSPALVLNQCQSTNTSLGTGLQRLRIVNDIATDGWNVVIAPTYGANAEWESDFHHYKFNSSAGSPPGCQDGQLSINPSTATVAPGVDCSNTGISQGVASSFSESVNEITLLTASSAAQRFCHWDVTGIDMMQQIPAVQPAGDYSIDFTITVTAQ